MVKIPYRESTIKLVMEEWRPAFEEYEISNLGNCRRKLKDGFYKEVKGSLCTVPHSKTYKMRYFQINRKGKRTNYLFSHLVAKCFIGDRPDGLVIDHIDRNPLNNNVSNLRYITQKENCCNTVRYRTDILETDKRLRYNTLARGYDTKKRRELGMEEIRPRGTGTIYQRETGHWRARIIINKIRYDKTFKTIEEAEEFLHNTATSL